MSRSSRRGMSMADAMAISARRLQEESQRRAAEETEWDVEYRTIAYAFQHGELSLEQAVAKADELRRRREDAQNRDQGARP